MPYRPVPVALTRALGRLVHDRGPDALDLAHATLDLFEQLETNIPFDAQTVFWRTWEPLSVEEREPLRALGRRLGFA